MSPAEVKKAAKLIAQLEELSSAAAASTDGLIGGKLCAGKPTFCGMGLQYPATVVLTNAQVETVLDMLRADVERELRDMRVSL